MSSSKHVHNINETSFVDADGNYRNPYFIPDYWKKKGRKTWFREHLAKGFVSRSDITKPGKKSKGQKKLENRIDAHQKMLSDTKINPLAFRKPGSTQFARGI